MDDNKTDNKRSSDIVCKVMNRKQNGAISPEIIYGNPSIIRINKELLIQLLEKENEIRLCHETKEKFDKLNEDIFSYFELDTELRKATLRHFKFNPDQDDSLKAYELACGKYINDAEIREKVVWMKYDKAKIGEHCIGDEIKLNNISLFDLKGQKQELSDLIFKNEINVVISGSLS